ncbi:S-adenosyl-L-methionine-dependent methyltransferase [Meredithblackwellia eburnea MCA 4105]
MDVPDTNESFVAYYKKQAIVPDEEWDTFIQKLHDPLPTTFRITSSREIAQSLNEMIKKVFVPYLTGIEHEGVPLEAPAPIPWYPDGLAWQLNVPKSAIRKNEGFKKFQSFLVYETDAGNLSRQEAVSMIPPLLLDVQPHHNVLDMCAAPGSKSAQLLEALHTLPRDKTIPPGLLIANDSDAKRCHLLVHQSLHRIPAAGMMVTNHDASQMPGMKIPINASDDTEGVFQALEDMDEASKRKFLEKHGGKKRVWKSLLFDRILADVPCSGDGTLRKNVGIWRDWRVGNGVGLHSLQLRIALRGIALLKPGGRMVYSTCSLNPVENEAVVSAILEACPDMTVVAVPDLLPNLVRRPGLTTWEVLTNELKPAPHPDDTSKVTSEGSEDFKGQKKVWTRTLWPNGKEAERGLENCLRLYPHLQDTGAFFVAVLEKKADSEAEKQEERAKPEPSERIKRTATDRSSPPPKEDEPQVKRVKQDTETEAMEETEDSVPISKEEEAVPEVSATDAEVDLASIPAEIIGVPSSRNGAGEFKEEPYIFLDPEDEQVKICVDFFDLDPSFPLSSLLVRNASGQALRTIYFTSPIVRELLLSNSYKRMRLTSCGVKLFARQDASRDGVFRCKWRVLAEGLELIRPFMGPKRVIRCKPDTLRVFMEALSTSIENIKDEEFVKRINEMEPGSCVLEVAVAGSDVEFEQDLVLPFWKSKASVNLMVEKTDKSALSLRLYGVDVTPHAKAPSGRELKAAAAAATLAAGESGADSSKDEMGAEGAVDESEGASV